MKPVTDTLRERIEEYHREAKERSPLFVRARNGTLSRAAVVAFLANVRALVAHTPKHLALAERTARARGDLALADYYAAKIGEEIGHDAWAERDLEALATSGEASRFDGTVATMDAILRANEELIERSPRAYLSYIFFAEYFTVVAGPGWLEDLERRCGIPRTAVSVIGNHAELDKEHATEGLDVIARFGGAPEDRGELVRAMDGAIERHRRFCVEVGALA